MRFAGYAALFHRADRGGDTILPGAFARAAAPVPLYWQHDPARPAGTVETLREDTRGLRVIGRITRGRVAPGMGLSFGYRVRGKAGGTNRQLTDLDLIEVSLVRHPMQPHARVHAVETEKEKTNGL